jgi:hypothetical protein
VLGQLIPSGIPVALVLGAVYLGRLGENLCGELLVGADRLVGPATRNLEPSTASC